MINKTYMIRFKRPSISPEHMTAASAEVDGDHLIFLNSNEEPVAFLPLEMVESWMVTNQSQFALEGISELVERSESSGLARLPSASMNIG